MKNKSPHVLEPDVGWTHQRQIQRILGDLRLRPPLPLSQPSSEPATALSGQLRRFRLSCPLPHCRLLEYLIIPFAFLEKELREACAVMGTSSGQRGCGWHGAGWLFIPLQEHLQIENPDRWLWIEDVAERRDHVGGVRRQSGALERRRKCWVSIKWPGHMQWEGNHQVTRAYAVERETRDLFSTHP